MGGVAAGRCRFGILVGILFGIGPMGYGSRRGGGNSAPPIVEPDDAGIE